MAIYHFRMKKSSRGGKRLSAVAHLNYINREGKHSEKEDLIEKHTENLPNEFKDINEFWKTCEAYERVNANLFRELEITLPKELTKEENVKLVKDFSAHLFGKEYVYNYSVHQPQDYGGEPQPHVHIMFCERKLDGISRPKEQFFKQHYTKIPEKSGAKKNEYWNKKEALEDMRMEWEKYLNFELEKRGIEKVSRKSLKDQKRDAEANKDYEKAKELDRKPIEIEGSILYRNEKKLTEKERKYWDINMQIPWQPSFFAADAVCFVVNKNNPKEFITLEEIKEMILSEEKRLIIDGKNTSNFNTIIQKLNINRGKTHFLPIKGNNNIIKNLDKYPNHIGVISYNTISNPNRENESKKNIKILPIKINNSLILPNKKTLKSQEYPLTKLLYFITREEKFGLANGFISYSCTSIGQKIVNKEGLQPYFLFPRTVKINTQK